MYSKKLYICFNVQNKVRLQVHDIALSTTTVPFPVHIIPDKSYHSSVCGYPTMM